MALSVVEVTCRGERARARVFNAICDDCITGLGRFHILWIESAIFGKQLSHFSHITPSHTIIEGLDGAILCEDPFVFGGDGVGMLSLVLMGVEMVGFPH